MGKTDARYITIDVDDYANAIRDISAGITDITIPVTYDTRDITGYSDGVRNVQIGQSNQPLTMSGVYDTTALIGAHTVLSRLVGVKNATTIRVEIGIGGPYEHGDPKYEGLFVCSSLVYAGDMTFTAEFVPAAVVVPDWGRDVVYTIGNDTLLAGNFTAANNTLWAEKFTATDTFTADRMYMYMNAAWAAGRLIVLGVYDDLAGLPDALLGQTGVITSVGAAKWYYSDLTTDVSIVNGTDYWLAFNNKEQPSTKGAVVGGISKFKNAVVYSGTLPNPFPGGLVDLTWRMNYYAEGV